MPSLEDIAKDIDALWLASDTVICVVGVCGMWWRELVDGVMDERTEGESLKPEETDSFPRSIWVISAKGALRLCSRCTTAQGVIPVVNNVLVPSYGNNVCQYAR